LIDAKIDQKYAALFITYFKSREMNPQWLFACVLLFRGEDPFLAGALLIFRINLKLIFTSTVWHLRKRLKDAKIDQKYAAIFITYLKGREMNQR